MLLHKSKDQEVCGSIMARPGTMATVSHAIALHFFQEAIYTWEPETLAMELKDKLDVDIDEENLDRLHAIISAITSDSFHNDWVAFNAICSTLNGENDPNDISEMTVAEFVWGIIEVALNEEDEGEKFSTDIAGLVGTILDQEGYTEAPVQLHFAKLPEKYVDGESEHVKQDAQTSYQMGLLHEYIRDQALTLFKQINALPWLSKEDIHDITESLSKEISAVANKKSNDPVYGNPSPTR